MIRRHEDNILSYFMLSICNASVEGLNNKGKIISRRTYGFRSVKSHILNLYHCLADLPWPNLMHIFVRKFKKDIEPGLYKIQDYSLLELI